MKTEKRFAHGLVIGISMFICMASALAIPSAFQAAAYSILHNFSGGASDGYQPQSGGPVFSGSAMYGMTAGGGAYGSGVLYKMKRTEPDYSSCTHSCPRQDGTTPRGSLSLSGSTLYGFTDSGGGPYATWGHDFQIDTVGAGYEILHNFSGGYRSVPSLRHPGHLGVQAYGMPSSGLRPQRLDFLMNTDGTGYQVLHEFGGKPDDGAFPYGSLTLVGSRLYGMTSEGGSERNLRRRLRLRCDFLDKHGRNRLPGPAQFRRLSKRWE